MVKASLLLRPRIDLFLSGSIRCVYWRFFMRSTSLVSRNTLRFSSVGPLCSALPCASPPLGPSPLTPAIATWTQLQLLGGYLYFHKAPNAQEFFEETRDKVNTYVSTLYCSFHVCPVSFSNFNLQPSNGSRNRLTTRVASRQACWFSWGCIVLYFGRPECNSVDVQASFARVCLNSSSGPSTGKTMRCTCASG